MSHPPRRSHLPRSALGAPALGLVLFSIATDARADELFDAMRYVYVSPGVVWSWAKGRERASGAGFEISVGRFVESSVPSVPEPVFTRRALHFGGFFRTQGYDTESRGGYARRAFGGQVGWGNLGLEAGFAHREGLPGQPSVTGVHLAPFLALGLLYVSTQFLVPTQESDSPGGYEINFALKLPLVPDVFALGMLGNMTAGGRPLVVRGVSRVAVDVRRGDWSAPSDSRVASRPPGKREIAERILGAASVQTAG